MLLLCCCVRRDIRKRQRFSINNDGGNIWNWRNYWERWRIFYYCAPLGWGVVNDTHQKKKLCSGLSSRFVKLHVVIFLPSRKSPIFNRPMEKRSLLKTDFFVDTKKLVVWYILFTISWNESGTLLFKSDQASKHCL